MPRRWPWARPSGIAGTMSPWSAIRRAAAFLAMMNSPEYAAANIERENGCADHAIVAVKETYNGLNRQPKE